jgi:predicted metal-dependent phosphoesterase TrpH
MTGPNTDFPAVNRSNCEHGRIDLHVHTTASDGQHSPSEIVQMALKIGLTVVGITDHDTTEGVAEAIAAARGTSLEVISGVEISTDVSCSEVHILGYFVAHRDPELHKVLARFRASRQERAQSMIDKLAGMGMPIEWERVRELARGESIGRPHIAQAMLERQYVSSIDEAFRLYVGRNRVAYVDRHKLSPAAAIQTILAAGGLPVLAHPLHVVHLVPELARGGLVGLEAYYTGYTPDDTALLLDLVEQYGLVVTGGSDFHGKDVHEGHELGGVPVPETVVEGLRAYCERRLRRLRRDGD